MYVFVSLGYIPKSRISGLYDNSIFNLLRTSQTIFQSDCTTLYCHQQCLRVLITPHPCQHLLLSFGWIHLSECEVISLCRWRMTLTIFLCSYWPFVYLLWRNAYSNPFLYLKFFIVFGHTSQHMMSSFPSQGTNLCSSLWKHRLLTTGPPGKSLLCHLKKLLSGKSSLCILDINSLGIWFENIFPLVCGLSFYFSDGVLQSKKV